MSKKFVKRLEERNKVLNIRIRAFHRALELAHDTNKNNVKQYDALASVLYDSDPVAYSKHFRSL